MITLCIMRISTVTIAFLANSALALARVCSTLSLVCDLRRTSSAFNDWLLSLLPLGSLVAERMAKNGSKREILGSSRRLPLVAFIEPYAAGLRLWGPIGRSLSSKSGHIGLPFLCCCEFHMDYWWHTRIVGFLSILH
jgi:hypothetical protein